MTTTIEELTPVRLRWGGFRTRYASGLTLIVVGVAATNLTSTYSLWFLAIGPAVQAIGWLLMPGALWRRIAVLLPCLLAGLALLAGSDFAGAFAVLLAGWLLVRHRPALSYLALLAPIVASFVFRELVREYSENWVFLTGGTAITVAAAWLAAWIAHVIRVRRSAFSADPQQT
jgi:hypothetical protein